MLTKLYAMNKLINLSKGVSSHTISGECILRFTLVFIYIRTRRQTEIEVKIEVESNERT